jgi:YgiT-type zinc finger domain-containing protein
MHLRQITFFTWLGEELITVPNFPAWVCDICGRRVYDGQAIQWLSALLNPEAGKTQQHKRRQARPNQAKRNANRPATTD